MTATGKSESSSGIDGARMGHFGWPDVGLEVAPVPSLARSHYRFGKPKSNLHLQRCPRAGGFHPRGQRGASKSTATLRAESDSASASSSTQPTIEPLSTQSARGTHTMRRTCPQQAAPFCTAAWSEPRNSRRHHGAPARALANARPIVVTPEAEAPVMWIRLGFIRSEAQTASATALCPPAPAGRRPLGPSPPASAAW